MKTCDIALQIIYLNPHLFLACIVLFFKILEASADFQFLNLAEALAEYLKFEATLRLCFQFWERKKLELDLYSYLFCFHLVVKNAVNKYNAFILISHKFHELVNLFIYSNGFKKLKHKCFNCYYIVYCRWKKKRFRSSQYIHTPTSLDWLVTIIMPIHPTQVIVAALQLHIN